MTDDTISTLHCANHPDRETMLRCNRCDKPICYQCAVRTPVGYRCKECVRTQQNVYYNGNSGDLLIGGAVALVLGGIFGGLAYAFLGLIGFFSFIVAFFAGPAAGGAVAEVIRRAVKKRRTRGMKWLAAVLFCPGGVCCRDTVAGLSPDVRALGCAAFHRSGGQHDLRPIAMTVRFSAGGRMSATFAAMRYPNYRRWFIGQVLSLGGTWMQSVAQGWLVYQMTGSSLALGAITAAGTIPTIFLMLPAGAITDRVSNRRLLMVTQVVMMISALLLAALTWLDVLQVWQIAVLALVSGIAQSFDAPARLAITPKLVEDRADLQNAIAMNSMMFNLARVAGPAIGGLVLASMGAAWCFADQRPQLPGGADRPGRDEAAR